MRERFSLPPDRKAFTLARAIEPGDIDENDHVNNVVYVRWLQDVGIAHFEARFTPEERQGVAWVALRHEVDYFRPLRLGDCVQLHTWVGAADGPRFPRFVLVEGPDGLCAQGRTEWCMVDPVTFRPRRIAPFIAERMRLEDRLVSPPPG